MAQNDGTTSPDRAWQTLAEFSLTGEPGGESQAVEGVTQAIHDLHLPSAQLERLKAIVAEAALNAMRRCNALHPAGPLVFIRVLASQASAVGRQLNHGWGFFLIERAMNDARTMGDKACYLIEVFLYLEGNRGG